MSKATKTNFNKRLQRLILSLGVHFMVYARCGETTFCSIYGIASYYGAALFQVCSYILTLDLRMHVINLISVHFSERFIVGTKLLQMHASKSENRNSLKKEVKNSYWKLVPSVCFFDWNWVNKSLLPAKSVLISHIILISKHQTKNIRKKTYFLKSWRISIRIQVKKVNCLTFLFNPILSYFI